MPNVLITGASRGIGAAAARQFGAEGWNVILGYCSSGDRAQALAEELEAGGVRALALEGDVSDPVQAAALVEEAKKRVHVISIFSTLEYLRLGGRISAAAAMAGNLLSIKPVITITDGQVDVIGKARGMKKANTMVAEFIRRTGGIDYTMPHCLGFTGFSDENFRKIIGENPAVYGADDLREAYDLAANAIVPVGATVGTYAGPDAVAMAYFDKSAI